MPSVSHPTIHSSYLSEINIALVAPFHLHPFPRASPLHPIKHHLVLSNRLDKLPIIHLVGSRVHRALEQLLDLLLAHLLAQIRQDVLDLALADEACPVFVEDLEAADVLLDVEGFAEAAGPVQDLAEGVEVDCERG